MTTLEDLGISPAPWSENKWQSPDDYGHDVQDAHRHLICEMFLMQGGSRGPNARIISAAPDMYEALREVWEEYMENDLRCPLERIDAIMRKVEAALQKAGGSEEVYDV